MISNTRGLFMVSKNWIQSKNLSSDERISKMWNAHTMEYYSALKKNAVLIHAATQKNLKTCYVKGAKHKRPYII